MPTKDAGLSDDLQKVFPKQPESASTSGEALHPVGTRVLGINFQTQSPLPVLSEVMGSSYRLGRIRADPAEDTTALRACFRDLMACCNEHLNAANSKLCQRATPQSDWLHSVRSQSKSKVTQHKLMAVSYAICAYNQKLICPRTVTLTVHSPACVGKAENFSRNG